MKRKFNDKNESTYKHHQFMGELPKDTPESHSKSARASQSNIKVDKAVPKVKRLFVDDFHSPVDAKGYIELRLKEQLKFYQCRLPEYVRKRRTLRLMLVFGTVTASVLARYGREGLVVVLTSAMGAIVSWLEFSDTAHKIQRYSFAITAFERHLDWWDSLTEVERASKESIQQLVCTSESIISHELSAWVSTGTDRNKEKSPESELNQPSEAQGKYV